MSAIRNIILLAASLYGGITNADFPDAYKAHVIKPPFSMSERVVDLTPALERARVQGKPILLYMGAQDCPPCRQYEQFLVQNQNELSAMYDRWLVVEVRSRLREPVGDSNKVYSWPYWWLITPELRQIRQLPQGSKHFLNLDRHKKFLQPNQPPS
jgi:thiol-disulfide isomerase/thioredoxin